MKKILVIGSAGAGKSTFAKKLQVKLGLPLIHLDQHYWKPGWVKPDTIDWEKTVSHLLERESWIMEGNYKSTFHLRFPVADTIILLDPSRFVCLYRVLKRRLKKNRVDEILECPEKIGFDLIRWVLWRYPRKNRRMALKELEKFKAEKKVVILRGNHEMEKFLAQ